MWLKILRQNISQLARRAKGSTSIEQKNGNGNNNANKTNNNETEVNRNEEQSSPLDKSQTKKKPVPPGGGPLLQQTEISTSQLDFFKMLDEKIESNQKNSNVLTKIPGIWGPDYDESSEGPGSRGEHVTRLLRSWELASGSWGPEPTGPTPGTGRNRGSLSGASAPVCVQRVSSAARVDGLQDAAASPGMPRHVLESISQSPTAALKAPPGMASPPPAKYGPRHAEPQALLGAGSPGNPYAHHFHIGSPAPGQQQQQQFRRRQIT